MAYEKQTRGLGTSRGCVFQPRWSRARRSSSYNVSCGKGQRSETVASASSPGDVRDAMTSRRLEVGWRGLRKGVAWHRESTSERLPIRMRAQRLGLRGYRRFSSSRRMAGGERGVDGRRCLGKDGEVRMQRQDSIPKGLKDLRNEWTSRLKVGGWRRWDWRLKAWRGEDGAQTSGDFARTSRQTGDMEGGLIPADPGLCPLQSALGERCGMAPRRSGSTGTQQGLRAPISQAERYMRGLDNLDWHASIRLCLPPLDECADQTNMNHTLEFFLVFFRVAFARPVCTERTTVKAQAEHTESISSTRTRFFCIHTIPSERASNNLILDLNGLCNSVSPSPTPLC